MCILVCIYATSCVCIHQESIYIQLASQLRSLVGRYMASQWGTIWLLLYCLQGFSLISICFTIQNVSLKNKLKLGNSSTLNLEWQLASLAFVFKVCNINAYNIKWQLTEIQSQIIKVFETTDISKRSILRNPSFIDPTFIIMIITSSTKSSYRQLYSYTLARLWYV